MTRARALLRAASCCIAAFSVCTPRVAKADGAFDAQRFHLAPNRATGYLSVFSPRTAGLRGYGASLWVDAFADSLSLFDEGGNELGSVVDHRLDLHLTLVYGFTDWFELGVDVPLVVAQSGDAIPGVRLPADSAKTAFGDVRLVPRVELVSQDVRDLGFGLGLYADLSLPTGKERDFRSDGVKVEPGLAVEYALPFLRIAGNAGYIVREESQLGELEHDDAVTLGAALEGFLTRARALSLLAEFDWERGVLTERDHAHHEAQELLFAARLLVKKRVLFELGGGRGLHAKHTAPAWRLFGGMSWVGRAAPKAKDHDGDGIPDALDLCVTLPEDRDGFQDDDGCPDYDNDKDGVPDAVDQCRDEPEDLDRFADEDGCPDPDNDNDGVNDGFDRCPNEREDLDGFQDDDGCLDADNDEDGIPDVDDGPKDERGFGRCRDAAEDFDGVDDNDGCPDLDVIAPAEPAPTCEKRQFPEVITFRKGRTAPNTRGRAVLKELIRELKAAPEVLTIRIIGHADDQGDALFNASLSQRRAFLIADRLRRAGVPQKLEPVGLGAERPLVEGKDELARAQNRRVEIVVVEQEGCEGP